MVRIRFQDLQVETVSGSSGIYSGSNVQRGFKTTAKKNMAFGTVNGKACFVSNIHASLDDRDRFDTLTFGKPYKR